MADSSTMVFAILGSCVTRDIFSIMDRDDLVGSYRSRTSLHSLISKPVPKDKLPNLDQMKSAFQRRMVEFDLMKTELDLSDCKALIVDFIDERFRIMRFAGTYVVESNEFRTVLSQFENVEPAFSRGLGEEDDWRVACRIFRSKYPEIQIILHSSRFSSKALIDGEIVLNEKQGYIEKMNQYLEMYEKVFIEEVKPFSVLTVSQEFLKSDPNHQWGLAPFHYIKDYYHDALTKLLEIEASL